MDHPLGPALDAGAMSSEAHELQDVLNHQFRDPALLRLALTHVSALNREGRISSYQRLEFLGDHVLGCVVSDMLYRAFPEADEGELSRRLAAMVRKETCAEVAEDMQLGPYILLGAGEAQSGGRHKGAILSDVCEAVIGAVFMDGGYPAAEALVKRYWQDRMMGQTHPVRDAKTRLQEWVQARGLPAPTYHHLDRTGPDHHPFFTVAVRVDGMEEAEGGGHSKRIAEQEAALRMLQREGVLT